MDIPHFSKPALRFLGQMLYGLQAAKDIKLSCIGRTLDEEAALKKTEERLSRNLAREWLAKAVSECVALEAGKQIGKDTPIVVDPTLRLDISNKTLRETENITIFAPYSGSEKGFHRMGRRCNDNGYIRWLQ